MAMVLTAVLMLLQRPEKGQLGHWIYDVVSWCHYSSLVICLFFFFSFFYLFILFHIFRLMSFTVAEYIASYEYVKLDPELTAICK